MKFNKGDLVQFVSAASDQVYNDVGLIVRKYDLRDKSGDGISSPNYFYDVMYNGNLEENVPEAWLVLTELLQKRHDSAPRENTNDSCESDKG